MYIYIYICTYMYVNKYMYIVLLYKYISNIRICIYALIYIRAYIPVYLDIFVWIYVYIYIDMRVCAFVFVCVLYVCYRHSIWLLKSLHANSGCFRNHSHRHKRCWVDHWPVASHWQGPCSRSACETSASIGVWNGKIKLVVTK